MFRWSRRGCYATCYLTGSMTLYSSIFCFGYLVILFLFLSKYYWFLWLTNHKLPFNRKSEDTFILFDDTSDYYLTKFSFTRILNQRSANATPNLWTCIWLVHLLYNIKFLVWLSCSNHVPTLSLLTIIIYPRVVIVLVVIFKKNVSSVALEIVRYL